MVPVPQDTEQLDQLLQGSDAGRGGGPVDETQLSRLPIFFDGKRMVSQVSRQFLSKNDKADGGDMGLSVCLCGKSETWRRSG